MKPFLVLCFTCDSEFQMGPHVYAGTHIRAYNMTVCRSCYSANWDGWGPAHEPKIRSHLNEQGISVPSRNKAGWLPRDG